MGNLHQHGAQLDKIAVFRILDFNHSPRVLAPSDLAALDLKQCIGTTNSKRNSFFQLTDLEFKIFKMSISTQ
jgi:hypothetical protein